MISLETLGVMKGDAPKGLLVEVIAWMRDNKDELMEEWKKWHD